MGRKAPRLQVVAVGAPKSPLAEVIADYEGRIARLTAFRVDEVAVAPTRSGATTAMRTEAQALRGKVISGAHLIALTPDGDQPADSPTFGKQVQRLIDSGRPTAFLIGGPLGLHADLIAAANERLSLGPLTLPHQLARAVLAEQIYRALATAKGHPYAR